MFSSGDTVPSLGLVLFPDPNGGTAEVRWVWERDYPKSTSLLTLLENVLCIYLAIYLVSVPLMGQV